MIKYIRYCFYSNGTSVNKILGEKKKKNSREACKILTLSCIFFFFFV